VVLVEEDPDGDEFDEYIDDFQLSPSRRTPLPKNPTWRKQLEELTPRVSVSRPEPWPAARETLYVVDVPVTCQAGRLTIELLYRDPKQRRLLLTLSITKRVNDFETPHVGS